MNDSNDPDFNAPRHFDAKKAGLYDEYIPRVIPGYDTLHQLALHIVGNAIGGQGRVLIVGVGTGKDTGDLCRAYAGVTVSGCDLSADMLAVAREKFTRDGVDDRIDLIHGGAGELPDAPVFDAAMMILVMHFIPDGGDKNTLLSDIAARLKPGAPLILADMFGDRDSTAYKDQEAVWRNLQILGGAEPEDVDDNIRHAARDTYTIDEARLGELLDEAGLTTPTPFFRSLMFGGWVARKKTT
ncbi:MAG: class I SAM-dependent methyltransferase [Alphaproteobacteria bacterium]|nr:class I SAM-dependent methyltransferase [Alphaproteobacteria bacterium]MBT7944304.1 class I SAM-dependent methyltransferase [Alphaproteobacteria bacterium]